MTFESKEAAPPAPPPHVQLIQMAAGSWVAAAAYAAAKLRIPDHLADGPKSAVELSNATGTHVPTLHRLMRTLAGLGILTEQEGDALP
ncbi:MAG: methyltransferase dimerization domain-containing protein [Alphaproteobacteria bacterium]|nr:methyltransferase dimerization domain-containing protein [Alphaproteobacteria bacterium]